MKHDAIVESGIEIIERVPIPKSMVPADAHVEIDAKVVAGYHGGEVHEDKGDRLDQTVGRSWEDESH